VTTTTRPRRPPIDPRIRERRIEVSRDQGRRRLRILIALLAVIGVVASVGAATRSTLLDVDHIVIAGLGHTDSRAVVRAARLDRHRLMIDLHADQMRRSIERLPWIASAHVERQWPATVRIDVRERVAVASVAAKRGGWVLADRRGRVLVQQAGEPVAGLPRILGGLPAGGAGSTVARPVIDALKVAASLPPELLPRVPSVSLTTEGIELRLLPSGVVKLGSTAQLVAKLDAVVTMLQRTNLTGLAVLDVRVPTAPVLTRG
jgi:cell division protein FtsQ